MMTDFAKLQRKNKGREVSFRLEHTLIAIVKTDVLWDVTPCIFVDVPLVIGA
jgi:hypothetical protein